MRENQRKIKRSETHLTQGGTTFPRKAHPGLLQISLCEKEHSLS